MEYFVISAKFVPLKYYTLSSQLRRLTSFSVGLFGSANSVTRSYPVMRKSCIKHSCPNKCPPSNIQHLKFKTAKRTRPIAYRRDSQLYFMGGGDGSSKIYTQGPNEHHFWAFPIYFYVFKGWSKSQTTLVGGPDLACESPIFNDELLAYSYYIEDQNNVILVHVLWHFWIYESICHIPTHWAL